MRYYEDENVLVFRTPHGSMQIDRTSGRITSPAEPHVLNTHPSNAGEGVVGLLGFLSLPHGMYAVIATKCEMAGRITEDEVYKVTATNLVHVMDTREHGAVYDPMNETYVKLAKSHLKKAYLYFSPTRDLTNTMQRLFSGPKPQIDSRFLWNHELASELVDYPDFFVPVVCGVFSEHSCNLNGHTLQLSVFSRRSRFRAGTRYFRRGLDVDGHAANFNETEQVVYIDNKRVYSYVQTRGSVPAFWGEVNNMRYKPQLQIGDVAASANAARKHFAEQKSIYGVPQFLVNLVNMKGYEKPVKQVYEDVVARLDDKDLKYVYFDFHRECSKMRWHRVRILLDKLDSLGAKNLHWFEMDKDPKNKVTILQQQQGVVRTNCMDCLDRTNVVQSAIALDVLEAQLRECKVIETAEPTSPQQTDPTGLACYPYLMKEFRAMWADNADGVSTAYSGTGALKTDFTRTGKRTKGGAFDDFCNSAKRYIGNNLFDGPRQDGYSLILGEVCPTRANPFNDERSQLMQSMPYIAGSSLAVFVLSVLYPSQTHSASFNTVMSLIFFLAFLVAMKYIFAHGMQYVNWPQLSGVDFVRFDKGQYRLRGDHASSKYD